MRALIFNPVKSSYPSIYSPVHQTLEPVNRTVRRRPFCLQGPSVHHIDHASFRAKRPSQNLSEPCAHQDIFLGQAPFQTKRLLKIMCLSDQASICVYQTKRLYVFIRPSVYMCLSDQASICVYQTKRPYVFIRPSVYVCLSDQASICVYQTKRPICVYQTKRLYVFTQNVFKGTTRPIEASNIYLHKKCPMGPNVQLNSINKTELPFVAKKKSN